VALSIFLTPYIEGLVLWQFVVPIIVLLNIKKVWLGIKKNRHIYYFIVYILIHSIITFLYYSLAIDINLKDFILRIGVFFCSFFLYPLILSYTYSRSFTKEDLNKFFGFIVFVTTAVTVYQIIAQQFGVLPVYGVRQGGRAYGFFLQITSCFGEPRFYSQFLIGCFYIVLFVRMEKNNSFLLFALVSCLFFTVSLGGYIACAIIIGFYLAQGFFTSSSRINKKIVMTIAGFILLAGVFGHQAVSTNFVRFTNNFGYIKSMSFSVLLTEARWLNVVNESQMSSNLSISGGSGMVSVIGELSHLSYTLKEHPLFGFGITSKVREMGLNAFVEIIFRWGLAGFGLFLFMFYHNKKYSLKRNVQFSLFFVLFCALDGAIAKPLFWLIMGLIGLFENAYSTQVVKSYIRRKPSMPRYDGQVLKNVS
jgi:hypothetical protein